jgi:hypothetical protein
MNYVTVRNSTAPDKGGGVYIEGDFPLQRNALGTIATIENSIITGNSTRANALR